MMPLISNNSTFSCVDRTLQFVRALASVVVGVVKAVGATAAKGLRKHRKQPSPKRLSSRSHMRMLDVQAKQERC